MGVFEVLSQELQKNAEFGHIKRNTQHIKNLQEMQTELQQSLGPHYNGSEGQQEISKEDGLSKE